MFEEIFGGRRGGTAPANKPSIMPVAPVAPAAQPAGNTTAAGKDISVEVEDLRKDVDKLKDSVNSIRETLKNLAENMESIENSIGQLASVYELLMNQMNPFLDEDEKAAPRPRPKKEKREEVKTVVVQAPPPVKEEGNVVLPEIDLTNPKVIQTILDWMQFIVERVGHAGAKDILQYYVDIRWISPEVAEILQRYADGIRVDVEPETEQPVQLDPEDHAKSLEYILQIKEFQEKG